MKIEDKILEYTIEHYPKESKAIERGMVNYYHSRLNKNKTDKEEFHQQMLFDGVIDLFELLAVALSENMGEDITKDEVFEHLKNIHIKT